MILFNYIFLHLASFAMPQNVSMGILYQLEHLNHKRRQEYH